MYVTDLKQSAVESRVYLNQYLANTDAWLQTSDCLLVKIVFGCIFINSLWNCNCSDCQLWFCLMTTQLLILHSATSRHQTLHLKYVTTPDNRHNTDRGPRALHQTQDLSAGRIDLLINQQFIMDMC